MNSKLDFPELKDRLARRQAELQTVLQDAAGAAVHATDAPAELSDFKDLAGHEATDIVEGTTADQAIQELADIGAALRRMREGSYGTCEECGDAIAPARLHAVPATALCAACQAARERLALRHA